MAELRQEPTTKEWVIVATERSGRPIEVKTSEKPNLPRHDNSCSFCPGQEHLTPPEVLSYQVSGRWIVRGFQNKFPILSPQSSISQSSAERHFRRISGAGFHEVIVETPRHDGLIPSRTYHEIELMLKAYRERYLALQRAKSGKAIVIFKNEGISSGASIIHPHSQLVVTPIVPPTLKKKLKISKEYFKATKHSIYRDVERWEVKSGKRLIQDTKLFSIFNPYASLLPFETWIIPKQNKASFAKISDLELIELARVLKDVISRFHKIFGYLDFNWVIHTAPFELEDIDYYFWHIQIQPRLAIIGGFEIGSGMYINTVRPEDAAAFLREAGSAA